jgi:hypothetical protein
MTPNKRDLKAYSRFDGTGRIVPGSTVLRRNKPKVGNWKETQAYECCDGGGGTVQLIVGDIELPLDPIIGVELITRCTDGPPYLNLTHSVSGIPPATITTYTELLDWLTTNFNYPGYTWLLTGPSTLEVIIDTNLLVGNCQNPNQVFFNWIYSF